MTVPGTHTPLAQQPPHVAGPQVGAPSGEAPASTAKQTPPCSPASGGTHASPSAVQSTHDCAPKPHARGESPDTHPVDPQQPPGQLEGVQRGGGGEVSSRASASSGCASAIGGWPSRTRASTTAFTSRASGSEPVSMSAASSVRPRSVWPHADVAHQIASSRATKRRRSRSRLPDELAGAKWRVMFRDIAALHDVARPGSCDSRGATLGGLEHGWHVCSTRALNDGLAGRARYRRILCGNRDPRRLWKREPHRGTFVQRKSGLVVDRAGSARCAGRRRRFSGWASVPHLVVAWCFSHSTCRRADK
jgi:hypothetical protein